MSAPRPHSADRARATLARAARFATLAAGVPVATLAWAGPYSGPGGTAGSDAVAHDDPAIVAWADGVAEFVRGLAKITDPSAGLATYGVAADALGPCLSADPNDVYDTVSLGDGGSITLTFAEPIRDGEGWDFAVFENAFLQSGARTGFFELAFVEVSSDGENFFRFPAVSLTPTTTQIGGFAWIDPTDLHNLAGKHPQGWGTPFDLSELASHAPLLDVHAVTHVRIIDVVGSIDPAHGSLDSLGNLINEPWPTPFSTGGFDLDAVAVRHLAGDPEPGGYAAWKQTRFTSAELAAPAISGDDADPDSDGRVNLLEYAFATDPRLADLAPDAPRAVIATDAPGGPAYLELHYTRPAGREDLACTVEWSDDLANWSDDATRLAVTETPDEGADGAISVVARALAAPGEMPRQFLRLRVTASTAAAAGAAAAVGTAAADASAP